MHVGGGLRPAASRLTANAEFVPARGCSGPAGRLFRSGPRGVEAVVLSSMAWGKQYYIDSCKITPYHG